MTSEAPDTDDSSSTPATVAAGNLLALMSGAVTKPLDDFSGWLLAGAGAAFAFLVAKIDVVSAHVEGGYWKASFALLIASFVAAAVAKYLATLVTVQLAILARAAETAGTDEELARSPTFRSELITEFKRGLIPSFRRIFEAHPTGPDFNDRTSLHRQTAHFSQRHAIAVFLQILGVYMAALVMLCGAWFKA